MENKENTKVSAMVDELILSSQGLCKCHTCGVEKPVSEFYKNSYRKNGFEKNCKECYKKLLDPEKINLYKKRYNENLKKDPTRKLFIEAKVRAKSLGIPFTIAQENIFVPKHCPVFGVEFSLGGDGRGDNAPSLDRIDPTKGYILGNVAVICWKANKLKNDATLQELVAIRDYMKSQVNTQKEHEENNNNGK